MEIQENEYVRTDNGEIFKVLEVEKGSVKIKSDYREWIGICCIQNHSFNIIDLIEEGDYVNGHRVKAVYLDGVTKYIKLDNSYEDRKGVRTYSEDIKSILTKQQFSNIEYKVVE